MVPSRLCKLVMFNINFRWNYAICYGQVQIQREGELRYQRICFIQSKEAGKYQESIQSNTTLDQGHQMGKRQKHTKKHHIQESQEVSPFPDDRHTWNKNNKNDPQKKHRLGMVSKKITRGFKHVCWYRPHLYFWCSTQVHWDISGLQSLSILSKLSRYLEIELTASTTSCCLVIVRDNMSSHS